MKNGARKGSGANSTCKNDPQPSTSTLSYDFGDLADDNTTVAAPPVDLSRKNHNPKRINEVCIEIVIVSSLLIQISSSSFLAVRKKRLSPESRVQSLSTNLGKK